MICLWIDQNQERDNRRCLNTLSIQEPDILGTPKRVYKHIYMPFSLKTPTIPKTKVFDNKVPRKKKFMIHFHI